MGKADLQGSRYKIQDTRHKIEDTGTTVRGTRCRMQDVRCETKCIQDTRYLVPKDKVQDTRTRYGTRHNYSYNTHIYTWYIFASQICRAQGTRYETQGTRYRYYSTRHQIPDTRCKMRVECIQDTWCLRTIYKIHVQNTKDMTTTHIL